MEVEKIERTINFSEICRLCMGKEPDMIPLFIDEDNLLERIINFIPMLKLYAEDGLPAQVCPQCVQRVHECYNFKLQCETVDATLRQLINSRQEQVLMQYLISRACICMC
ncbi:hypothetical protein L9F63_028415 [Diploptera punctata]|uniref:ZAD domain-containing protein n=1 Tax=Diploptera punctata TaxID=6984 RepID=A0AAD8EDZ5_DIPPU|nr:hypothetical protein L9F63_006516 [Diploptera punctata]KAJ9586541.1 hypothetical protein L9F63_028414 [Diploptera punctata]KAJ9586542.1 hypothetical protein L9F63_028415 [Diploptera punctata]